IGHGAAIRRKRLDRNARTAFELILDEICNRRLDLMFLVQGGLSVVNGLVDLGLVKDLVAVGAHLLNEEGLGLKGCCSSVNGGRVQIGLTQGKPQLRQVSYLVNLTTGRLEENRCSDTT